MAPCKVRQYSDQMICETCELTWDAGESDPPKCPRYTSQFRQKVEPEAHQIVAVGDNPILADVAQAHEPLVYVRGAVAQAMAAANMQLRPVLAVSLISVGDRVEDQMLVFSPGGDTVRNARMALERMRAATLQLEQLVEAGAFDG